MQTLLLAIGPALCCIIMIVTLLVLLVRYFLEAFYPGVEFATVVHRLMSGRGMPLPVEADSEVSIADSGMRKRLERKRFAWYKQLRLLGWIVMMMVLSRLLIYATALVGFWMQGELDAFIHSFSTYWVRWDAPHYVGLIENWYVAEGDPRFHIVFFPLYPLVCRILKPIFVGDAILTGVVVSNLCLLGAGWALYQIVVEQLGERAAKSAVRLLMFCPLSVFFSIPYAESMFLMLTLMAVLFARRRSFPLAVLLGALAASTRLVGLAVAIPIWLEMLKEARAACPPRQDRKRFLLRVLRYTGLVMLVALGFLAYLLLNKVITGNSLTFLTYQKEHWGQTFGSIWNSFRYTLENALHYDSAFWQYGVWIPQALSMLLILALLLLTCLKVYPGDGAYMWMYMFCSLAPTWLLSGPRYLAAMYPLYILLPQVFRSRVASGVLLSCSIALMVVCSYMYAVIGNIL